MTMPRGKGSLSEATRDSIIDMAEAGKTRAEIGRALGVSHGSIDYWCFVYGTYCPTRSTPGLPHKGSWRRGKIVVRTFTEAEDAEIMRLSAQHMGYTAIARELGKRWPERPRRGTTIKYRLMTLLRREARAEEAEAQREAA